MAKIMVPPEKLEAVSRQFAQARELGAQICGRLSQQIQMLENSWAGTTQQRFYQDFHRARGTDDYFNA